MSNNKKGYIANIEKETLENDNFRKVLYTNTNSQLVVMSLKPGEDIGSEVHETHDQFIRIEAGFGIVTINNIEHAIKDDFAIIIPAGAEHNILNTSDDEDLKLYSIYSPPEHRDGVIHQTKEFAELEHDRDHFDGEVSEK